MSLFAFRHSWIRPQAKALELLYMLQCIAVYLQRTLPWVSGDIGTFSYYQFPFRHTQKKTGSTCSMNASSTKSSAKSKRLISFQLWHPRWLDCCCLSNPYKLSRGVVAAHTRIIRIQYLLWTVVIYLSWHRYKLLSSNTVIWQSVTGERRHRTPATLPFEALHGNLSYTFSRSTKHDYTSSATWHSGHISASMFCPFLLRNFQ